jgi:hypothetical protein
MVHEDVGRSSRVPGDMPLPGTRPALSEGDALAALDYILAECFFGVGCGVGERKTIEHSAIVWWRDRYREKFRQVLARSGNTWMDDRGRVAAVCRMLGDRAVLHAGDGQIDLAAAAKASKDVEKFCAGHAERRHRRLGRIDADPAVKYAGYWCVP